MTTTKRRSARNPSRARAGVAGLVFIGGCFAFSGVNQAALPVDPLAHLSGRWVGQAVMTPVSGPKSSFKCIVTYLPRKGGFGMQQNLRCDNGADFKLHASTELAVEGERVTGRWQDKINEVDGTVTGTVTAKGFDVMLNGKYFEAKMAVAGEGCDQSVMVKPKTSDVFVEFTASLKKC